MTKHEKNVADALIRQNFMAFVIKFFPIMNPGAVFLENWHHRAIAYELTRCEQSFELSRLLVNLPPQHGKSELISVLYVAWRLGRDPALNILCVSYGEPIAERFASLTLLVMQSDEYRRIFPGTILVKTALSELVTSKGGRRMARSVHGPITGHPADVIIIDDPHKIDSNLTNTEIEKTNSWADETLASRLTKPSEGIIICVMQRVRLNDLTNHYLTKPGEPWRQLKLALVATKDEVIATGPDETYHRKNGEILHPAWRGAKDVEMAMGNPLIFSSQHQQDPAPGGGVILKPEYIKEFDTFGWRHHYESVILAVDAASSLQEHASYSAFVIVGIKQNRFHVLAAWRSHVELLKLERQIISAVDQVGASHIFIEDASMGTALRQLLWEKFDHCGVYWETPKHSKEQRLYEVLPLFLKGRVLFPPEEHMNEHLIALKSELLSAPNGKTDDLMDALVLALRGVVHWGVHNSAQIDYRNKKPSMSFWERKNKKES